MKIEDRKEFNAIYKRLKSQLKEVTFEQRFDMSTTIDGDYFFKYEQMLHIKMNGYSLCIDGSYLWNNTLLYIYGVDGEEYQNSDKQRFLENIRTLGIELDI